MLPGLHGDRSPVHPFTAIAALLAPTLPSLLAYNVSPSATLWNQCLALACWGWLVIAVAPTTSGLRGPRVLQAALALLTVAALASAALGSLPWSLALSAAGSLACAMVMVHAGAAVAVREDRSEVFAWIAGGLVLSGLLNTVIAVLQVFLPGWTDGSLIATSGLPGRAVGNLRQPNHLSSLLLWGMIGAVALTEMRRVPWRIGAALFLAMLFGDLLSGSRTGPAGMVFILLPWALIDRSLSRQMRILLIATPVIYVVGFEALKFWADSTHQVFGAAMHVGGDGADVSNSRFRIWANTLALIRANPWTGVGFGEFNFAWSLSDFPGRPVAFFDHTHNLILNLAVELGLPLAALVLALFVIALLQAWRRAARLDGDAAVAARSALVLVLMIGLHSQLEYPLWYNYFLLPTAWFWGYALGLPRSTAEGRSPAAGPAAIGPNGGRWAGAAIVAAAVFATVDYNRVVVIFEPPVNAGPLAERIAAGQASPLFAYHADYAAATSGEPGSSSAALGLDRAPHFLLDTRLMIAWAQDFERRGDTDRARWLAARLREFDNRDADDFFATCTEPEPTAFQCRPPETEHGWREFGLVAREHARSSAAR
jgi:O-antigen ligase